MEQPLHDDLMIGVEKIAKFTGQSERRVFHMLAMGQLPGFKLGGNRWAARKSALQQHILECEREGAREAAARREAAERDAAERKAAREAAEAAEGKARKRKTRKRDAIAVGTPKDTA
jgi:hypothetical protein